MLKSLRRGKQWQLCEKIAEDMIAEGLVLDNFTYSTLISCAKQCNLTEMALKWFNRMNDADCVPDEVTYSSMIDVYGAAGLTEEALELYERLRRRGWNPDQVTFGTIANVYAKVGDYKAIERLFWDMKELGVRPNVVVYNTYILALSKAGKPSLAMDALCQMEDSGIKPTTVTLSILIEMYSKLGAVDDAFAVFKQMQQEGLNCDRIVYNSLISACAENSLVKEAEDVLVEMEETGHAPDEATYRCMISAYATRGMVEEARRFLDRLLKEGYKPNVQVYSSLVRACKQARQYDKVPLYFEEMIINGCKPDQRLCGMLLGCLSTCEDKNLQDGILGCLQWTSITLHDIAKRLLAKDTDGPWLTKQIKAALDEMPEDSHRAFCNTLIDMCMSLGYTEGSHQILGIGVTLGMYENIQVRSDLEWRLNLRGLSLSAAQCAVEGWVSSLTLALKEGEHMPRHFIVETGGSKRRVADQIKLSETIPSLLKKLDAPFEEDLEAGAFVATASAVKSWLESRNVSI
ncbi:hypothetical protein O6H91_23G040300 [Diphasiastrum complanatum]|nr:hypothetical protein O6H91_23G040300 [Diphasiastrum complanatum]